MNEEPFTLIVLRFMEETKVALDTGEILAALGRFIPASRAASWGRNRAKHHHCNYSTEKCVAVGKRFLIAHTLWALYNQGKLDRLGKGIYKYIPKQEANPQEEELNEHDQREVPEC